MRLLWVFAALCLQGCATVPATPWHMVTPETVPARHSTELTDGWSFRYDDSWTLEDALGADSAAWQPVSLPHSWNRLGQYATERSPATDKRQGKGWYRLTIDGRLLDPSRHHWIEFDAVGNVADVWLNGSHVGSHAGAFTRFRIDLTDGLDLSGDNILLVRADNSEPKPDSTTRDVIPLLGDFFVHGGIYRPARLISVSPAHIALGDFGGPGVYASTRMGADGTGIVDALVRLEGVAAGQTLHLEMRSPDGKIVARGRRALGTGIPQVHMRLRLPEARAWNGRRDPFLYTLAARLEGATGVLDGVTQPLGFRAIRFDPDEGFFLNGENVRLRGVSRHQDKLGQGWALSPEDEDRDMALIAEMGANSVRVAHYPQSQHWFDLADRYGMVVWAEVPFVNKVSFGDAAASPQLVANARMQLTEMIRQNFNHPSIVTWGIGNEVDIDLAFKRLGPRADARPLLRELNAQAHREDASRPTVIADCCEATPGDKADYLPVLTGEADLMGYNRYFGWYYGEVGDLGPHLDRLHALHPQVPLSVSEYGAGGALTQHSASVDGKPTNVTGRPQPEEFQSWWHEQSWPQIRERGYLWGSWIWNMFDFSSPVRHEGDATDINTKGLVSFDRAVRKDAFFYYKAQWSDEPVVHITSRRFAQRHDPTVRVKIYSNAPAVMLEANGVSLGTVPCIDRICLREAVTLRPGENMVTARAAFGGRDLSDSVSWTVSSR